MRKNNKNPKEFIHRFRDTVGKHNYGIDFEKESYWIQTLGITFFVDVYEDGIHIINIKIDGEDDIMWEGTENQLIKKTRDFIRARKNFLKLQKKRKKRGPSYGFEEMIGALAPFADLENMYSGFQIPSTGGITYTTIRSDDKKIYREHRDKSSLKDAYRKMQAHNKDNQFSRPSSYKFLQSLRIFARKLRIEEWNQMKELAY